ncbi:MAG TPA: DUF2470 domain-containing protein [Candidatus Binatia bacterium]|nr:DUF2470 domain-containing protein [Candidatus Binatia bacterium]
MGGESRDAGTTAGRASEPAEPPFAERVRTLLEVARLGTLSTHSARHAGFPFGSLAPFALLEGGTPTFLLSRLAMHTENVLADPRASLLVAEEGAADDALASGRATLLGTVARIEGDAVAGARASYLERHPAAAAWVEFADFAFYRLDVTAIYWVAGFGRMGWVDPAEYRQAAPDPLVASAPGILAHMNADHGDALVLYCRVFGGVAADVDSAEMLAVDRLGFRVRAATAEGARTLRIPFPRPVATPEETRKVLVEMVRDARARVAAG